MRFFRLHENHQHWMTLKITDNQYGRLFEQQLGFLFLEVGLVSWDWAFTQKDGEAESWSKNKIRKTENMREYLETVFQPLGIDPSVTFFVLFCLSGWGGVWW